MLKFTARSLTRSPVDLLALPVCEDADIHNQPVLQKLIAQATALEEFSGEKNQQVMLYNLPNTKVKRCLFIGLGPQKKLSAEALRIFAGRAIKAAMAAKRDHLIIAPPLAKPMAMEPRTALAAIMQGACLANHSFDAYKEAPKQTVLKKVSLLAPALVAKKYRALLAEVETVCQATLQAREWVSTPANDKPPQQLAQKMVKAAQKTGLKIKVWNEKQLQQKKFGALLAVAAGSDRPPRMVEMVYAPKGANKTIVLVGKGVTFDTGGINLKPSAGLQTMKADMSGAAAVAATMLAVARLKPKHRIVGITPLVENMPSGRATRPGDIVTSYAGKTVEIGNTDAEGRLILIDAMAYAIKQHKPDVLIDLATLTGACVVALGEQMAGLFSPDEDLAQAVLTSAEATYERCWRLPLTEEYKKLLKSNVADINNMAGSRYGGAITAALFLSEFVGDTRWAHIDIAGTAYQKKASDYCGPGGTGFGVRLLCDLIKHL